MKVPLLTPLRSSAAMSRAPILVNFRVSETLKAQRTAVYRSLQLSEVPPRGVVVKARTWMSQNWFSFPAPPGIPISARESCRQRVQRQLLVHLVHARAVRVASVNPCHHQAVGIAS